MRSRLGARHPVYLRARFLLGQACAQQHDDVRAGELFAATLEGQRAVLGRAHPETLRTQHELAAIRKLQGDGAVAIELFAEVRRLSAHQVGRATDLHWRAVTGESSVGSRVGCGALAALSDVSSMVAVLAERGNVKSCRVCYRAARKRPEVRIWCGI